VYRRLQTASLCGDRYASCRRKPSHPQQRYTVTRNSDLHMLSWLAYFWTLKMGATYSSETPDDVQRTIWRYTPEDGTLKIWLVFVHNPSRKSFARVHRISSNKFLC
jgi:hypothetical protein